MISQLPHDKLIKLRNKKSALKDRIKKYEKQVQCETEFGKLRQRCLDLASIVGEKIEDSTQTKLMNEMAKFMVEPKKSTKTTSSTPSC